MSITFKTSDSIHVVAPNLAWTDGGGCSGGGTSHERADCGKHICLSCDTYNDCQKYSGTTAVRMGDTTSVANSSLHLCDERYVTDNLGCPMIGGVNANTQKLVDPNTGTVDNYSWYKWNSKIPLYCEYDKNKLPSNFDESFYSKFDRSYNKDEYNNLMKDWCFQEVSAGCKSAGQPSCLRIEASSACQTWCDENTNVCTVNLKKQYCVGNNLQTDFCLDFCKGTSGNCDTALGEYCKNLTNDQFTQDASNNNLCGCFHKASFYANYFDNLNSKVLGIDNTPGLKQCYFNECAVSNFKPQGSNDQPCPSVNQCITVANINNDGTILGDVTIKQDGACSAYSLNCKQNERISQGKCEACTGSSVASGDHLSCKECGKDSVAINNVCTICPPGQIANHDKNVCVSCPDNQYTDDNMTCKICPDHFVVKSDKSGCYDPGNTKPEDCNGDTYFVSADKHCQQCPAGQITSDDHKSCKSCPSGTTLDTQSKQCLDSCKNLCPSGKTCSNGQCVSKSNQIIGDLISKLKDPKVIAIVVGVFILINILLYFLFRSKDPRNFYARFKLKFWK